jgi:phage terminase large subunit-like protein
LQHRRDDNSDHPSPKPPALLKAEAYQDESLWRVTNPNLGASVDRAFLRQKAAEAEQAGSAAQRGFWAKHLNVEIDVARRAGGWAGAEFWAERADPTLTFEALLRRSEVITIGADGGGRDDLLALCLLGREKGTGRWLAWCKAWAWPSALQQRKSEAARYEDFRRAGDLVVVDAVGEDLAELVEIVGAVRDAGLLPEKHCIGVDPGNHHAVTQPLLEAGFDDGQIVWVSQGWRLGGAMTLAERMLAEGSLVHAGQPLMAWCVGNAKVEPKGNARIITKQASGSAKVDAVMAMLNAVELMSRNPTAGCVAEAMIV